MDDLDHHGSSARYHSGYERNDMKELFTRSFWEGVKKTFDEAREGPPPPAADAASSSSQPPDKSDLPAASTRETQSLPAPASNEPH